jgi:hypothetical protein
MQPTTNTARHNILMWIAAREYRQLWRIHHDDVSQIADIVIWQNSDWLQCRRALHRELYHFGRSMGYQQYIQTHQVDRLDAPLCSVEGCGKPGMYRDPDFGRLCRTHGMTIRTRRKRGASLDRPLVVHRGPHGIPAKNRKLWRSVRASVSPSQWDDLWAWGAKRLASRPRTAIRAARKAIGLT